MSRSTVLPRRARASRKGALPPLVLDLDDALLRTDLLHETALSFIRQNPLRLFLLVWWLLQGKAVLKRRVCERVILDVDHLPLNEALVDYAQAYRARGGKIGIATAADELLARRIAARIGFADFVIASDGKTNMKGAAKAAVLRKRFPEGFVYAADGPQDIPVWRHASGIVLAGASRGTARAARATRVPVLGEFPHEGMSIRAWIKGLRMHQWAKNALVFVPLILSGSASNPALVINALIAFAALSLLASGTYLVNDLFDLADDRKHWSKVKRPLASGRLRIRLAVPIAFALIASGLAIGATLNLAVLGFLAVYMALTLAYSMYIKRQPVLDVFTLAVLFTLRIGLGIAAIGVVASPWLIVFSMFLFASLSCAKRLTEIQRSLAAGRAAVSGRGYLGTDKPLVLALGVAFGVAAINVMVLYLIDDAFALDLYREPRFLWVFPAVLSLWIGRIWLLCHREQLHDDPVVFALRDPASLVLGATMGAAFLAGWLW